MGKTFFLIISVVMSHQNNNNHLSSFFFKKCVNYFHHPRFKANDNNSQWVPNKYHQMFGLEDLET